MNPTVTISASDNLCVSAAVSQWREERAGDKRDAPPQPDPDVDRKWRH